MAVCVAGPSDGQLFGVERLHCVSRGPQAQFHEARAQWSVLAYVPAWEVMGPGKKRRPWELRTRQGYPEVGSQSF